METCVRSAVNHSRPGVGCCCLKFRGFRSQKGRRLSSRVQCVKIEEPGMSLQEIKARLGKAVLEEDYKTAAHLRDVLAEKELDMRLAVEDANEQFYRAFRMVSIDDMKAIWGKGVHVQCVHPGQECISGDAMVLESWEVVLSSMAKGNFEIVVQDVRVAVGDQLAFVTCVEVVKAGPDSGRLVATNLFEKQEGRWVIVHHHASPTQM